MTDTLASLLRREMAADVPPEVRDIARTIADDPATLAVLFYGSNLRSGSLDGVLDFYVLLDGPIERGLWPRVGYRELVAGGRTLRAKIATMRLSTFEHAAAGRSVDTTIWTRFVQPSALVWSRDNAAETRVTGALSAAAMAAARFAAALGPAAGSAQRFWEALFRQTYAAEFRVERAGRADSITAHDPARYAGMLPLAWDAAGIAFRADGETLRPDINPAERHRIRQAWQLRRAAGKPLNLVRLARAAFTFDGAARYGAWKIERHTGVKVQLTPWRERHPILAAPGVFWRVWRTRSRAA